MKYKKVSKSEALTKQKDGVDLVIYGPELPGASIAQVRCEEGHFTEFYMDDITFTYTVVKGVGIFVIEDEEVDVQAGDLISIPPETRFHYFGTMHLTLVCTPAYDPEKEHHVRDLTNEDRYKTFGGWLRRQYKKDDAYKEYLKVVPTKRMAAGILITNEQDEVLIVQTRDLPKLQWPGGIVEEGESPQQCVVREMEEELGVKLESPRLLHVGYASDDVEMVEALYFCFDGGVLTKEQIDALTLQQEEIKSVTFMPIHELSEDNTEQSYVIKKAFEARENTKNAYSDTL